MMYTFTALLCLGLTLGRETPVLAGTLPKPILTVQPDSVVSKQTNVTFLCEGTTGAKEYHIYKDGGQHTHFIQFLQKSQNEAEFSISKTDEHHAGQYRCCYQTHDGQSECSDSVELVVTGAYSKPSLSVQPSQLVTEGGNVTFQCDSREQFDRFILTMEGPQKLSWMQDKHYNSSAKLFQSLFSVGPVTSSQRWTFRCYGFNRKRPQVWSEPSDTLELLISGTLHKPTIKAEPGTVIAYKSAVTIWCQGSLDVQLYVLHKQGNPKHCGTQSPEGFGEKAKFFIPSVTEEHVGHYQCYSYNSDGWSEPSDNLEIVVTGFYHNKPILSALSGPVAALGGILTLQCVSQDKYHKFILTKKDEKFPSSLNSQNVYTHEHSTATFSMSPVTPAHRGTFRCYGYRMDTPQLWTVSSDPLEIHVSGLSKKPFLLTLQGYILDPGKTLTLQCSSDINYDRFALYKVGESDVTQKYGQRTQPGLSLANFTLGSVSSSTGGQYRCYGAHKLSSEWSAPSDPLDIMITGQLPFTSFLSVKPNSTVHPGDNVTFLCGSRNPTDNFIVYKDGTDHQPKQLKSKFQDGHFQAELSMSGVTSTFSGRYRCYSSLDSSLHLLSNASSPVEITVSESMEVSSHRPLKPMEAYNPPPLKPMEASSPPPLKPMEASSPPPLKPMEASSPPPLKPMEASSPPPLKPMEASSPPPLKPMEAYSHPPLKPTEASSPPPLKPMETYSHSPLKPTEASSRPPLKPMEASSTPPLKPMEFSSLSSFKTMEPSSITPLEPRQTAELECGLKALVCVSVAFALFLFILIFLLLRRRQQGKVRKEAQKEKLPARTAELITRSIPAATTQEENIYASMEYIHREHGVGMNSLAEISAEPQDVTCVQPFQMTLRQETAVSPPSQAKEVPEESTYILIWQSSTQGHSQEQK